MLRRERETEVGKELYGNCKKILKRLAEQKEDHQIAKKALIALGRRLDESVVNLAFTLIKPNQSSDEKFEALLPVLQDLLVQCDYAISHKRKIRRRLNDLSAGTSAARNRVEAILEVARA